MGLDNQGPVTVFTFVGTTAAQVGAIMIGSARHH